MRILVSLVACAVVLSGCSSSEPEDDTTQRNTNGLSQAPKTPRPFETSRWGVVGVQRGDTLNVRRQPRPSAPVVATLSPLATGVQVGKRTSGEWRRVTVAGRTGWAHGRYLAMLGKPVDVTAEARRVGIAPTGRSLARKIAIRQAGSGDGPLTGPVLVARKKSRFTTDVLGYADDAIRGERFVAVVVPGEAGFEVRSVTATPICARAVDASGLCV